MGKKKKIYFVSLNQEEHDHLTMLMGKEKIAKNIYDKLKKWINDEKIGTSLEEIIKQYLEIFEYDGLYNFEYDHCGCFLDNLMPCGDINSKCAAGYKKEDLDLGNIYVSPYK